MTTPNPARGEIWLVDFNPTIGAEIQKQRPALVVSSTTIGILPLRIVVPFTSWQSNFGNRHWMVRIVASKENGLTNDSAADCFQAKSVSTSRFIRRMGVIPLSELDEIVKTIAIIIEAV